MAPWPGVAEMDQADTAHEGQNKHPKDPDVAIHSGGPVQNSTLPSVSSVLAPG